MIGKKERKKSEPAGVKTETLWRKPIALDTLGGEDPLAPLYQGREASETAAVQTDTPVSQINAVFKPITEDSGSSGAPEKAASEREKSVIKTAAESAAGIPNGSESGKPRLPKITESELKDILKVKSDSYHFTDLREILRGRSFDIYAYLSFLSGDTGICKIKHLDLMKRLDLSRPTLFKQGEWLMRLSLVEKRNVPGDHFGTSYTVYRLDEILPVSGSLVEQLESRIETFRQSTSSVE